MTRLESEKCIISPGDGQFSAGSNKTDYRAMYFQRPGPIYPGLFSELKIAVANVFVLIIMLLPYGKILTKADLPYEGAISYGTGFHTVQD
jgi:hypothetical protein